MQAQVSYWQDVLGIQGWVRPYAAEEDSAPETAFGFVFLSEESLTPESEQALLLGKMIAAMKWDPDHVGYVESSLADLASVLPELKGPIVFCLSAVLADFLQKNYPQVQVHALPSLSQMLQNPALKKQAWDVLRKFLLN